MEKRLCTECGRELPFKKKKFCSEGCRQQASIPWRKCNYCGKMFRRKGGHYKFCSEECYRQHEADNRKLDDVECPVCKKVFTPRDSRQVYCSTACRKRNEIKGATKPVTVPVKKKKTKETLSTAVERLERYNAEHGTGYTYGQAVAMGII